MAIINGNTFNIYSSSQDPRTRKNSFECDDIIAPIIRTLNLKGYKTRFCCAGHPYIEESKARVYSNTKPEKIGIEGIYSIRKSPNKQHMDFDGMNCYIIRFAGYLMRDAYISFEEGCVPTEIPSSWEYDQEARGIYREFSVADMTPLEFFREQLECMEELQEWADYLPQKE